MSGCPDARARAVAQVDERVDDRLRVHDHVDPVVRRSEQVVGLDQLEALVHQRRRVDRDLAAHVPGGCASACSTVTSSSSARMRPRNGPPEAVSTSLSTVPGRSPAISWCSAECSESTGIDLRPGGLGQRRDELAADDQRLLVGQREVDPLPGSPRRRPQPGRADERVEHEVGAESATQLARAPRGPTSTSPSVHASAARAAGAGSPARSAARRAGAPAPISASCEELRGQADDLEVPAPTTSSAWVPIEPGDAEDEQPLHRRPIVATPL